MTARDSWAEVAHQIRVFCNSGLKLADSIDAAIEPAPAAVPEAGGASAAPPQRSPAPAAPRSEFTSCPKHGKAFTPSKNPEWPAYCTEKTDDPAWGKQKTDRDGNPVLYCRITSKNAVQWIAVNKAAPQMDVDDIPF